MKRNTFLKIAKDVVGTLLVLIPAIILSIYMAGSQLADLSGIVLMVVSGIVGLIIAVGLIYSCVKYAAENNSSRRTDIRKEREKLWKHTELCDKDIKSEIRKIKRLVAFDRIWFFFICICNIAGIASAAALSKTTILTLFVLLTFFSVCFANISDRNNETPGLYIDSETYPSLHSMISETVEKYIPKKDAEFDKDIFAFAVNGPDIVTARWRGGYAICIGISSIGILTREQLRMAVIHEICHIKSGDADFFFDITETSAKYRTQKGFFTLGSLLMAPSLMAFDSKIPMFMAASPRAIELRCDRNAALYLSPKEKRDYIGAVATVRAFGFFLNESSVFGGIYEEETPPYDFESGIEREFRNSLNEREDFWRKLMEKELEANNAPCPTFRQRREAMGVAENDFDICPDEDDYAYSVEQDALRRQSDKVIREGMQLTYDEDRKAHYLSALDDYNSYLDKLKNKDYIPSLPEMLNAALAAEFSNRRDEARELYEEILKKYPKNANALYRRGLMYLTEYDDKGIDMIYAAMEDNSNFISDGVNAISDFCIKMGLSERLAELRERSVDLLEYRFNKYPHVVSTEKGDKYEPADLPEPILNEIISLIENECGKDLDRIYIVKKTYDDSFATLIFISPVLGYDTEKWARAYHNIFTDLDVRDELFVLDSFVGNPPYLKNVQSVPGSLKYDRLSDTERAGSDRADRPDKSENTENTKNTETREKKN